jgi:hypothetical protein
VRRGLVPILLALLLPVPDPDAGAASCDDVIGVFERAYCEVDAARETPLCPDLGAALERKLGRDLQRVRTQLGRAETKSARRRVRLVRRARPRLAAARRRVKRAKGLSAECRTTLDQRLAGVRDALAALLANLAPPPGLPGDVAGYETWLRLNTEPIPVRPGGDPHFGVKNVFVNRSRDEIAPGGVERYPFPEGSIVVKASTAPGDGFVGLFAIMWKKAGSDPAHGDWTFVEYERSSARASFRAVARDGVCWSCHGQPAPEGALETDYVFTRIP